MDEEWMEPESAIIGAVRPFGVSIDYDDTFTSRPKTWTAVITVLRNAGARVVCVTSRKPETPVSDFPGEVFYCSGRPKAEVMHENGVDIHVWIDDQPEYIGLNPERIRLKAAFGIS